VFVAPAGAWITLDAGKIANVTYTPVNGTITLMLDPATATTPAARLRIEMTTQGARPLIPSVGTQERDGYTVPLDNAPTTVKLSPR
jgi:hypothetical protein